MTEHKITAKRIAQKIRIDKMNGCDQKEFHELHEQMIKDFALQVATEAVDDEIKSYDRGVGKHAAKMHGESILKNIKKRLNDKNCEEG